LLREPHLDLLALTSRLLEALGASERPGNVAGSRAFWATLSLCDLVVRALDLKIDRRHGSGAAFRAFVSRCKVEKASLDIRICSRGQITHHTGTLLSKILFQHGSAYYDFNWATALAAQ
jgi:hypothetical protein